MANIKLCKLVDGSTVIGTLTKDKLNDAVDVIIQQTPDGMKIGFMPILFPFNEKIDGVHIDLSKILVPIDAPTNLREEYEKQMNPSGLVLASSIPEHLKSNVHSIKR